MTVRRRRPIVPGVLGILVLLAGPAALAADDLVRVELEPTTAVVLQQGRLIYLECRPSPNETLQAYYARYLADPAGWRAYQGRQSAVLPFTQVRPDVQRRMLDAAFPDDVVDNQGWWHVVQRSGTPAMETLRALCEWLTGRAANLEAVRADARNRAVFPTLEKGEKVLVPAGLLRRVMREPAPRPVLRPAPAAPAAAATWAENGEPLVDLEALSHELTYGKDTEGEYAVYRLKPGEALYTAVVVRFTDYRDNSAIHKACATVQKRSGIRDVHDMQAGQKILIPLDMLSDRFSPQGSAQREEYEETIQEARRLRGQQVRTKELEGVVVVLDPGHGGRDQGGRNLKCSLYEDELNYDIACRIKEILETRTRAKVYMTLIDRSQKYVPTNATRFTHDTDEELLTTPPYPNTDAKVSANLRWYLANSIYRAERAKGTDPRKIVFTSIHTDALFDGRMRGAMVYIPGATYRRENERPGGAAYAEYRECREAPDAASTAAERRRDEALSRNFAEDIITCLGERQIRRHLEGDCIRSKIRQDGGRVYLPAVLRNTLVPTKVLVEVANMTNETDCLRLADPQWRQTFAEAYVDALKRYYGS